MFFKQAILGTGNPNYLAEIVGDKYHRHKSPEFEISKPNSVKYRPSAKKSDIHKDHLEKIHVCQVAVLDKHEGNLCDISLPIHDEQYHVSSDPDDERAEVDDGLHL